MVVWTFIAAGLAPVLPRLVALPGLDEIAYLDLLLFLPAVIVGGVRYLAAPAGFRVGPLVAIVTVMTAGLLWVDGSERGRGLVELALVATPIAVAVTIRERREWRIAVITYILVSCAAALYLFHDWTGQAERTGLNTSRFGGLYDEQVARIMEPNITATHLAFGVLLTVALWLLPSPSSAERRWRAIGTVCLPVLAAGVMLSGSRGGTLSLLGALTVLAALTSIRRSLPLRTNLLGGLGLAGLAALLLLAPNPVSDRMQTGSASGEASQATESQETEAAGERTAGSVSVEGSESATGRLGGRTTIWRAALEASASSRSMVLIGAGTGGADHAVAKANPKLHIARVGEHDVLRANAHSTYLYWLVSFGVIGVAVAVAALGVVALHAVGNDWRIGWGAGVAMLAFFLLTSVTLIASRLGITSIAVSALTLGYIMAPAARWNHG